MAYTADPGGHFDSDVHRRVLCAVADHPSRNEPVEGKSLTDIIGRLDLDPHVPLGTTQEEEVLGVLEDLVRDGHVTKDDSGWIKTKDGIDLLTGPPAEEL